MKKLKKIILIIPLNENSQRKFFDSAKDYIKNLQFDDLTPDYSGVRPKLFFTNDNFSEFYINEENKKWISEFN